MSTSRDSCCLPSVKKQKHDFQVFTFVQCIIKQLLDSVFVISRIIKVSVRVISLSLRLRLITLTSTLIILDITKTSSNNIVYNNNNDSNNNNSNNNNNNSRLFTALYFSHFFLSLNVLIESRENWTPAQNGRLDWVGDGDQDK